MAGSGLVLKEDKLHQEHLTPNCDNVLSLYAIYDARTYILIEAAKCIVKSLFKSLQMVLNLVQPSNNSQM